MVVQIHRCNVNSPEALPCRFERKFYLTPPMVGFAYGLVRNTCLPDGEFASEQINSLYFDTADMDQHQRSESGDFLKDKVRIRWYGREEELQGLQPVFIELKSKQAFANTKQRRRLMVPSENLLLKNLSKGIVPATVLVDTLAGFGYFPYEELMPIVAISYWRYRFSELITDQRVSIDCHIRSTMIIPGAGNGERSLELAGAVIEIKGQTPELPETLRRMKILNMDWTRFSKYSACIDSHTEEPGAVGRLSPTGRLISPV